MRVAWLSDPLPDPLGFQRRIEEDLDTALAFIEGQPEYPDLRRRPTRSWAQDERALGLRWHQNRLHNIAHRLRLGMLKAAFGREAPEDLRAQHRQRRQCETAPV